MLRSRALLSAFAVLILAAGCNPQGGGKPPDPKLDTDDSKAIYALGLLIAERIEQFNLSESELDTFAAGVRDGVMKNEKKVDPKALSKELQAFSKSRQTAAADKEKTESAAYLAKMAAEPGATKAPSGYIIKTVTRGPARARRRPTP
jgi:FKBP-type peptidyl-prolyl cis-trans isomerase